MRRLEFALEHQPWVLDDCSRVIWSDEANINRFAKDGGFRYGRSLDLL